MWNINPSVGCESNVTQIFLFWQIGFCLWKPHQEEGGGDYDKNDWVRGPDRCLGCALSPYAYYALDIV